MPTWHQKYKDTYFRDIVKEIGFLAANAEYNNSPHVEGTVFKDEHFHWVKIPKLKEFQCIVGWWDVAYSENKTSDYNAIPVQGLHNNKFYVIDTFCKQCKMRDAVAWMCQFQKTLPSNVRMYWYYEAQFWNDEIQRIIDEVQDEYGVYLNLIKRKVEKKSKEERIMRLYPYYQNNRIYYNIELKGLSDMQVGTAQLKGIEPGYKSHDDWADAQEGGIGELEKHTPTRKGKNLMGKMKPKYQW
jgi:phage terminase large subunit-like protein